jgi:hypothetical protein
MLDAACLMIMIATSVLLIWSGIRAWRINNALLRWSGTSIGPALELIREWKLAEFIATMRTGTDPSGHQLSKQMPWGPIGKLDDEELAALYEYLTHLSGSLL